MARLQFKVTFTNAQPGAPVEILTPSTEHVYPSSTTVNPVGGKQLYLDGTNSITVWSDAQAVIAQTVDGTGAYIQGTATVGSPTITVTDGTAPTNPPFSAASPVPARRTILNPSGDTTGATDQAAVQAAANALITAGGGTLELGAGDFYWNSLQLDIYTVMAKIKIIGQGQATKIHNTSTGGGSATTATIRVNGGGYNLAYPGPVGTNWIEIRDLELIGTATCGPGVMMEGCFQGRIDGVYARDHTSTARGYHPAGIYQPSNATSAYWGAGIFLYFCISVTTTASVVTGNTCGMYHQGNINATIGGTVFNNTTVGIYVDQCQSNTYDTILFQGNNNDLVLASLSNSATTLSQSTAVRNCWFEQCAVKLSGATDTILENPAFDGPTNRIFVGGFAKSTTIVGMPKVGLVLATGSTGTTLVNPYDTFNYATDVQDGTNGLGIGVQWSVPPVNKATVSTGTYKLPSPIQAPSSVLTLAASPTLTFPLPVAGQTFGLTLAQDATGSRTVTWDSRVIWPSGTAPTLTTTASRNDEFAFKSDGVNWYGRTVSLNANPAGTAVPQQTAGLAGWWDASQIVASDNTVLMSWPDLSGNGRHLRPFDNTAPWSPLPVGLTGSAKYPIYYNSTHLINGQPCVFFKGDDQLCYLLSSSAAASVTQPFTIYMALQPESIANFTAPLGSPNFLYFNGSKWVMNAGSDITSSTTPVVDSIYTVTLVFNGASSILRVNGTQVATGNAGAAALGQLRVGAFNNAAGGYIGYIGEILAYSGAHSGATLTALESYMSTKW